MSDTTDPTDELAREMYAAYLQVSEGFGPEGASNIARRQCPETYYDDAEFLLSQAGPIPSDGAA
jgi:hypothetical protein